MSEHPEHPTDEQAPVTSEPRDASEPEAPIAPPLEPAAEPAPAEPAATEPAPAEPPAAEPAPAEPAATEPAPAEPAATEPAPAESAAAQPAATETPAADATPAESAPEPTAAEAPAAAADAPAESVPAPLAATEPAPAETPAAGATPAEPAAAQPRGEQRQRPQRDRKRPERRRKPNAAQRHRNAFYAKLSELRRQDEAEQQGRLEGPTAEDSESQPAAEGEGESAAQPASQQPQQGQRTPLPGRVQARVRAAVERVGGEEAMREALAPKQRPDGQTMKWSAVCCDAAQGHPAGDPIFTAWARLAVTPVREIKSLVDPRDRDGRGRGRGGPRRGGGGGGGGRGDRPWRDRGGQDRGYAGAEEVMQHGRDGSLKTRMRIVDMSKGREKDRADEGEKQKREASDRLDRLGY